MIEVSERTIFNSLKRGYMEYVELKSFNNRTCDAEKIRGWCLALEAIIKKFAPEYKGELDKIKIDYLKEYYTDFIDLDIPTILRKR